MNKEAAGNRLGLCLSGGGFRASFYHIGVLAKMAELGILKHVEVISTVSGGSIVGAAYYLFLKELLESKSDATLQDSDYVEIVQKLEKHFLSAVQKNLRLRTFSNILNNIKMLLPSYSRSDAIGELYNDEIYAPILNVGDKPIVMRDLLINPKDIPKGEFYPGHETLGNQTRTHKVPVLVLNATSLNSGHNWCFTASWMGEVPPRNEYFCDVDKKDRYRRVYYKEIESRKEKDFKLGKAVAASAGVPGLFPPLSVSKLYLDRQVQLVDGGVFDNQGIAGVLDPNLNQRCSDFIVSDASGQSDATDNPKTNALSVLINTSSILTGRVREEMVNSAEKTHDGHMAYMHLTRGIFAHDIEFNEKPINSVPSDNMKYGIIPCQQEFNVHEDMQRAMSKIRTDLDSFSDIEAGCLQADGYQMSHSRLLKLPAHYQSSETGKGNWNFKPYIEKISNKDDVVHKHLEVATNLFFKPLFHLFKGTLSFKQSMSLILLSLPFLLTLGLILCGINFGLKQYVGIDVIGVILHKEQFKEFVTAYSIPLYIMIVTFGVSMLLSKIVSGSGKWVTRLRKLIKSPVSLAVGLAVRVVIPIIIALPIMVYLYTVDKYFINSIGKLR